MRHSQNEICPRLFMTGAKARGRCSVLLCCPLVFPLEKRYTESCFSDLRYSLF